MAKNSDARSGVDYEEAVRQFGAAVEHLNKGRVDEARTTFQTLAKSDIPEPELIERARMYVRICERRASSGSTDAAAIDPVHRAVFLTNAGQLDEALAVLDPILQQNPTAVDPLYVRASVWALRGVPDKAVADLRQAILVEPSIRFQAVNDPDFERIREEPSFIDIIEPSPTGA